LEPQDQSETPQSRRITRAKLKKRSNIRFGISLLVIAGLVGSSITLILTNPTSYEETEPTPFPITVPTRVPFEQPTAAPTSVPDVVIAASAPLRLEIPSVGFDSANIVLPAGQTETFIKWTEDDNRAHGGSLVPPSPYKSSLVYDTTVPGGGLFGTDAQTSGLIAGHTSRYDRPESEQGVFQPLIEVDEGDPVAITTANGKLCYNVITIDSETPKNGGVLIDDVLVSAVAAKYRYAAPIPGVVYIVTCYRPDVNSTGPTTENLVLVLQLNQGVTNAGSC